MGFTLIKGTYHVVGYSPDGDSIRFKANNSSNWLKIKGRVNLNAKEHAQLRFQAIDTLETHYKKEHQPLDLALEAMEYLLQFLGIKNVAWDSNMKRVQSADDGVSGYVLCREAEKYGRPIVFVFSGDTEVEDGKEIYLNEEQLEDSANYQLLLNGLAYPTYYKGLFHDLREKFSQAVETARQNEKKIYSVDKTNEGFEVLGINSITDDFIILPKLFRRLLVHLKEYDDLSNFKEELAQNPESILIIDKGHFTNFDDIVEFNDNKLRLTEYIENVIFNA